MFESLQQHFAQLGPEFGRPLKPTALGSARLVHINHALAEDIDAQALVAEPQQLLGWASGQQLLGPSPIAMKYSGHQFGVFNPELGDGRGLLLGEWRDGDGQLWDLHLKGAGRTPYSRFGDGRAVLRSSIREYLIGESLNALGIASSRALCLVASDDTVMREQVETCATIVRTARSHIRFGSFEEFFYQRRYPELRQLADYCIERYCPKPEGDPYAALLQLAVVNTADTIGRWQAYGFNHGVMNTDNMSIIGDSFDFGPYAFLDDYQADFVCNHSDTQGRYSFEQQPAIGLWNLNALAHALSPLLNREQLQQALIAYQPKLIETYQGCLNRRLGLMGLEPEDAELGQAWLDLLAAAKADFHLSFRQLSHYQRSGQWPKALAAIAQQSGFQAWREAYQGRTQGQDRDLCAEQMDSANPIYLPRTHLLQQVIEAAQQGDYQPLAQLYACTRQPFKARPEWSAWAQPPATQDKGICLSCSS